MEVKETLTFKDKLKPLEFRQSENGEISLTTSLLGYQKFTDGTIWLVFMGVKRMDEQWALGFKIELKEMTVRDENNHVEKFIPTRFALRKLNPKDEKYGMRIVEMLNEKGIDCPFKDLKDFSGFELETSDRFDQNSLLKCKVSGLASNVLNKRNKAYFNIGVDIDLENFQMTIKESKKEYRDTFFDYIFQK